MASDPIPLILKGPLARGVLVFGAPLAVGMGLQVTFNLVDAYLVSRLDADVAGPALGAIGICDQIAALGSIVSYGVSTAAAAIMSRRQGRGDLRGARQVAWQSTAVVLVLGILWGVLGLFGADWLMKDLIGARGRVASLGSEYLRVILGGNVTIFLLLHLTTMQRALGSSKTPILILLLSNLINLGLAILLVYGDGPAPHHFAFGPPLARALGIPRLGLLGAAWATVVARLVVLFPLVLVLNRRFGLFRRDVRGRPDAEVLAQLFRLGWPASTQLVLRIFAMLVVHSLVARTYTSATCQDATTALGVVFRLETMALFISLGWGSAAQTFVGQNLGAAQRTRALYSGWMAALYNALMMLGLTAILVGWGRPIVTFFDEDPRVVLLALGYLLVVGPSYVGLGTGIVLGSAMQGAGASLTTLVLDACVLFGLLLPAALGVTSIPTEIGVLWQVIAVAYAGFAVVYALVYRRGRFLNVEIR